MTATLLYFTLIMVGLAGTGGHASPSDLLGTWRYDGFFYQNHRYENPNPELILTFTFKADGTNRLFWYRTNDPGFCEREANYYVSQDELTQKITWANPANRSDCAKDPDMQVGRTSTVRIDTLGDELHFLLELKGEPFHYILRRCSPSETNCPTGSRP